VVLLRRAEHAGRAKARAIALCFLSAFQSRKGTRMSDSVRTVLVVDDDPDLRELMRLLLEGAGYRVETARDGREALERVFAHAPALVLLDMKMPGMNGWQFARTLRQTHNRRIPIVVVTAGDDARRTAEEVGAEAYLGKPFELDDVLKVVELHSRSSATA
jgi:CheY-like chemotaxis protein